MQFFRHQTAGCSPYWVKEHESGARFPRNWVLPTYLCDAFLPANVHKYLLQTLYTIYRSGSPTKNMCVYDEGATAYSACLTS